MLSEMGETNRTKPLFTIDQELWKKHNCVYCLNTKTCGLYKEIRTHNTVEEMKSDLITYVLNKEVPDTKYHREVWKKAHPGECLSQEYVIHHINGNHDDNRPENLQKMTSREHRQEHARMDMKKKVEPENFTANCFDCPWLRSRRVSRCI